MKYKLKIFMDGPDGPVSTGLPDGYSIVAEEDPAGPWVSREWHDTVAGDRDELAGRLKAQQAVRDQALTELAWWFNACVGPCEHVPALADAPGEPQVERCFVDRPEEDWCLGCRATSMMDISTKLGEALAPLITTEEERAAVREEAVVLPEPARRHRPDDPGYIPRALRVGVQLMCSECCNGDRCDDPTHWRRGVDPISPDRCPWCCGHPSEIDWPRCRIQASDVIPGDTLRDLHPAHMDGEVVEVICDDVKRHLYTIRLTDDADGKRSVHVAGEQILVIEPQKE